MYHTHGLPKVIVRNRVKILALEHLLELVLRPLLVCFGHCYVPSVKDVELESLQAKNKLK